MSKSEMKAYYAAMKLEKESYPWHFEGIGCSHKHHLDIEQDCNDAQAQFRYILFRMDLEKNQQSYQGCKSQAIQKASHEFLAYAATARYCEMVETSTDAPCWPDDAMIQRYKQARSIKLAGCCPLDPEYGFCAPPDKGGTWHKCACIVSIDLRKR